MLLMETGNWHESRQHISAFTITRGRKEVIIETSHEIEGRSFENIIIKNEAKGKIDLIFSRFFETCIFVLEMECFDARKKRIGNVILSLVFLQLVSEVYHTK